MYTAIGSFNAKAKLSELLRAVKRGQRYTITLRGEPVADLIPSEHTLQGEVDAAIHRMQRIHKIKNVTFDVITDWIQEGRK